MFPIEHNAWLLKLHESFICNTPQSLMYEYVCGYIYLFRSNGLGIQSVSKLRSSLHPQPRVCDPQVPHSVLHTISEEIAYCSS